MGIEYSIKVCQILGQIFRSQKIFRPQRIKRYDPGAEISYEIKGVAPARTGRLKLVIEKFVGGGYAGQVYKVKALAVETPEGPLEGLDVGHSYAMKIFIPPTFPQHHLCNCLSRTIFTPGQPSCGPGRRIMAEVYPAWGKGQNRL
jgi:hypothetical protein